MRTAMRGRHSARRAGFTLAEVLIAIVIVGIVASISLTQYGATVQRARYDTARDVLLLIYSGEQTYYTLQSTYAQPAAGNMTQWRSWLYMDDPNLRDPDGSLPVNYVVTANGTGFYARATKGTSANYLQINDQRNFTGTWGRP